MNKLMKMIVALYVMSMIPLLSFAQEKSLQVLAPFSLNTDIKNNLKFLDPDKKLISSGNVSWYLTKTDKYFHLIFQVKTPQKETKSIFLRVKNAEKTVAIINNNCSLTTNTAMRLSLSEKISVKKITFDGKIIEIEIE